jgi:hypothetical protein
MTTEQMQTVVADAGKINKHLKPFNDEVRRLMKDDEERFNRWYRETLNSRTLSYHQLTRPSLLRSTAARQRTLFTASLKTLTTPATIPIPRAPGTILLISAPTPASLYVTT